MSEEYQMRFIILPLTHRGKEAKQACIRRCFDLAREMEDKEAKSFLLSGMLVFSDKVIAKKNSKRIKAWLMLTKVEQLFEEEKLEYARKAVIQAKKEAKEEADEALLLAKAKAKAEKEEKKEEKKHTIEKMSQKGFLLESKQSHLLILRAGPQQRRRLMQQRFRRPIVQHPAFQFFRLQDQRHPVMHRQD